MKMEVTEVKVNDIEIHYRSYGQGEPLLLIMGLGGNADWWDEEFLHPLSESFQVVTFDNRGTGRSSKPDGPYSIAQMASDAVGLMDQLGWKSAHIAGISMGGMIAQELACTYPQRVRRLVLISTNCGGKEQVLASPEAYTTLNMPREKMKGEDIIKAMLPLLYPPEFMERNPDRVQKTVENALVVPTPPRCFAAQLAAIVGWSIYPRLRELSNPTLIITGGKDVLIPPDNARILAEAIPNSRLVEIPEAGHGITAMFPLEVAREITSFLTGE